MSPINVWRDGRARATMAGARWTSSSNPCQNEVICDKFVTGHVTTTEMRFA